MLSHRKDPRTVFKAYAYAAAAKLEDVNFYFFSPELVNLNDRSILAWVYENGKWVQKRRHFPDVIYNASPSMTEKQEEIVEELSKGIPITSHSIGDKLDAYQKIKDAKMFAHYLIPSIDILQSQDVSRFLNQYSNIVLKPLNGHKGHNIVYVQRNKEIFIAQQGNTEVEMNKIQFEGFAKQFTKKAKYFAQAFIESKTKTGLSTHFRLHVQKDGEGKWMLTTIYPCIAGEGIVANLINGGYTTMFEVFLKQEFDSEYYNVKRYLEQFAIYFSEHIDSLYQQSLDELGIDIGLDSNHRIWIFEVNWRPGTPTTFSLELDIAKQTIRYARYLVETI